MHKILMNFDALVLVLQADDHHVLNCDDFIKNTLIKLHKEF